MSPAEFLAHADRVLSVALQTGNAGVSSQGAAELHVQAYRRGFAGDERAGFSSPCSGRSGPGKRKSPRVPFSATNLSSGLSGHPLDLSSIMHSDFHSARVGVRRVAAAA